VAKFNIGDLVVLKSGSMRMCVEAADEDMISTVWCNEGQIGRDNFAPVLLNKWEHREDDRSAGRGGPRGGGDRDGGFKGRGRDDRGGDRGGYKGRDRDDDRPPRKTGWDGKPRDKKYFRKDDD